MVDYIKKKGGGGRTLAVKGCNHNDLMMGLSLLAVQCKSSQPENIAVSPLVVYPPVIQLLNLIVTLTIILTLVRKLSTQQLKPQEILEFGDKAVTSLKHMSRQS